MAYHRWLQFLRQQSSLRVQQYHTRATRHSRWPDFDTFLPGDAALLLALEAWMQNTAAGLRIQVNGIAPELLEAIRGYGAMLEGNLSHVLPPIRPTAVGTVTYDAARDKLYYGVSGFNATIAQMNVDARLTLREQTLHLALPNGGRTAVWQRSPRTCSEYKALNRALLDGANEQDLHVWAFRSRDMRPIPRCPNCRVTVTGNLIGQVWTG
jgi:hypothetical protein